MEDLTAKVFKTIIGNGKEGILQSELWKELDLTSRDGSRVAIRLEKRSLIRREKILESGRWTYKLYAVKLPVDTQSIEMAPCLTCPVEHMCSIDGTVSPNSCNLIEDWLLASFNNFNNNGADVVSPQISSSSKQIVTTIAKQELVTVSTNNVMPPPGDHLDKNPSGKAVKGAKPTLKQHNRLPSTKNLHAKARKK